MKLHYKIMLIVSFMVIGLMLYAAVFVSYETKVILEDQMSDAAGDMSAAIAQMPEIGAMLASKPQNNEIQDIIESLRQDTRYQYIIVMDMDGIQYSYPYESGLYKPYKNGGETAVLEHGISETSTDTNELISAVRSFYPIFHKGEQVGAVLVGLLTDDIQEENEINMRRIQLSIVLGVFIGVMLAVALSINIKKSIFNMEPNEIALLLTERNLIFQSIGRGTIAVNNEGIVILCNQRAERLIGRFSIMEGIHIRSISESIGALLDTVWQHNKDVVNKSVTIENGQQLMVSIGLMKNPDGLVMGAVVSMENLTLLKALAKEVTDYRETVDILRAYKHEAMNRLMTISGLIQLKHYDEAVDFIALQTSNNERLTRLLSERIRDNKLAGVLLTHHTRMSERKIDFVIDEASEVVELPKSISSEELCTVVANLLENSCEALINNDEKHIEFYIYSDGNTLELSVYNNGEPIKDDSVFEKGFSTKGGDRGYGLYLCKSVVESVGGSIKWENRNGVIWHVTI